MKLQLAKVLSAVAILSLTLDAFAQSTRPRVIVLTDIEDEPDDAMSMVRFLTCANQWDVEGLIATTSVHLKDKVSAWRIREIVEAYRKVQPNLTKHEPGYPEADTLLAMLKEGRAAYGMTAVGKDMDSPGSDHIIKVVDQGTIHVVLAVTDQGTPPLTRYKRVVVTLAT